MSHYSVMVLVPPTKNEDLEATLTNILAPWHEFECTGRDDRYVVDLDETDEARATYERDTVDLLVDPANPEAVHHVYGPDGNYNPAFSRPNPDYPRKGGPNELIVPEGWLQKQAPAAEHKTFLEWVCGYYGRIAVEEGALLELGAGTETDAHRALPEAMKYGYVVCNAAREVVKVVRRTNPNKKWDWWEVGGRYSNRLIDKQGQRGDVCDIADLDLSAMRDRNIEQRRKALQQTYGELLNPKYGEPKFSSVQELLEVWAAAARAGGFDALVAAYKAATTEGPNASLSDWVERKTPEGELALEPALRPVRRAWELALYSYGGLSQHGAGCPDTQPDPEAWALEAPPVSAYAMVDLEGRWHAKGEMGWFGMDTPTAGVTQESWEDGLMVALKAAPAGTIVAMVDCHI